MEDNKEKQPVSTNETPAATPQVETSTPKTEVPAPSVTTKVETKKPVGKKPGLSKLRKLLIVAGSCAIGFSIITLILDAGSENGTGEIIMFVLTVIAFIATEVLSVLTFKREPEKKVFPLVCLIICSTLLGIGLIVGIFMLFSIF